VKREELEIVHAPVLLNEVVEFLQVKPGGIYVDGTVGGGGHAKAILEQMGGQGIYIAIDRDRHTLDRARETLTDFKESIHFVHGVYSDLPKILSDLRVEGVDGILLDLGVSSFQLEGETRGFSFLKKGPLDMRMDPGDETAVTAAEIVNEWPEKNLAEIFYKFGEERFARRIARAIAAVRRGSPFTTTTALAEVVAKTISRGGRFKIHPATRVFQALRIEVNDELDHLQRFLSLDFGFLRPGGRIGIISFHSLEDRLVKQAFRSRKDLKRVTKKPVEPSEEELQMNPRSRSAKLRVVEKVEGESLCTRPMS